jgi:hypothetical protein
MTDLDQQSLAGPTDVDTAVEAYVAAKTLPDAVIILRARREALLTEAAESNLRERIARERGLFISRRRRRMRRQLQARLIFLQRARRDTSDAAWRRLILDSLPGGPLLRRMAQEVPEAQEMLDAMIKAIEDGPEALARHRRELMEGMVGTFGRDSAILVAYFQPVMETALRSRSPVALLRLGRLWEQMAALAPIENALEQLDTLQDESEVAAGDLVARRQLLARELADGLQAIRDPVVQALGFFTVADKFYEAVSVDPKTGEDAFFECERLFQEAARRLRARRLFSLYSQAQRKLAYVYGELDKRKGGYRARQLQAIRRALSRVSHRLQPGEWASLQMDLGVALLDDQTPREQERAIAALQRAQEAYREEDPTQPRPLVEYNLGIAFVARRRGKRSTNLLEAVTHFNRALEPLRPEWLFLFDQIHADRAAALAELGRLEEAHHSLLEARRVQSLGLEQSRLLTGFGRDAYQQRLGDIYLPDALILAMMKTSDARDIAVTLEEGRARALRVALSVEQPSLRQLDPAQADAITAAWQEWQRAQAEYAAALPIGVVPSSIQAIELRQERLRHLSEAYQEFTALRERVQTQYPSLLTTTVSFPTLAQAITADDEAIVYLAASATGFAVIISPAGDHIARADVIALPSLTLPALDDVLFGAPRGLLDRSTQPEVLETRGYYAAQIGSALAPLERWGASVTQARQRLPRNSALRRAVDALTTTYAGNRTLLSWLNMPFDQLREQQRYTSLANIFGQEALKIELPEIVERMAELGLSRVAQWLEERGIRRVALVPYGRTALLSWGSTLVETASGAVPFAERFEVHLAPSALAYSTAKQRGDGLDLGARPALFAAGDPERLPDEAAVGMALPPFPQADPDAIVAIAQQYAAVSSSAERRERGLTHIMPALTGAAATKKAVLQGVEDAWFVALSMHGRFIQEEPLQSRLDLANGESIILEECLNGTVRLNGVRLVILAACDQSIVNVRKAENEALGMATGFLQAGAAGVIAPLWAVDNRATFLLMTRFAEMYLDPRQRYSPAQALAKAQHWLRKEATSELLTRYDPLRALGAPPRDESVRDGAGNPLHAYDRMLQAIREAASGSKPDWTPYANPYFWAGFEVIGH